MKIQIILISLLSAVFSNACAETDANIEKYKENYAKQLIPLLKERMGTETGMDSEADANEHISTLANRMADCQLVAIKSYPQKYQDASIIPVANGAELRKASEDLNQLIQTDIKNGDISDEELKTMTEAAIEKYKVCLSDSEPNPDNLPQ